jgi:enamine deaminase RidA (YjgF/YER057c/UK114 family)
MRLPVLVAVCLAAVAAPAAAQQVDPEGKLRDLGITLPAVDKPFANYVKAVRTGNLVYLAGHGPCGDLNARPEYTGKVGKTRTVEEGYAAARATAICLLASLKAEVGDLRKVRRIVKVLGMVNATEDFTMHPMVINGASDLFVEVFGDRGRHARSAVGMISLPLNITVEIEMIVEVDPT